MYIGSVCGEKVMWCLVKSHAQDGLGSDGSNEASRPIGRVAPHGRWVQQRSKEFGFLARRLEPVCLAWSVCRAIKHNKHQA